jgi:hypothetical protein
MHRYLAGAIVALALAFGTQAAGAEAETLGPVVSFPATLDGTLAIDTPPEERTDGEEGTAFGFFISGGNEYTVELSASLYAKAPDGGAVRVTFEGMRTNLGFPVYRISALEPL